MAQLIVRYYTVLGTGTNCDAFDRGTEILKIEARFRSPFSLLLFDVCSPCTCSDRELLQMPGKIFLGDGYGLTSPED